ncbi:hypothetical protein [uncultured Williamsia sp.]|uniref:hypothetical protein n=1 Tax=uncultured Williamsia sp. TaxID=259311 RepID=UPI00262AEB89|nr:hypothetical protein [uncultured Williamsia sp.]
MKSTDVTKGRGLVAAYDDAAKAALYGSAAVGIGNVIVTVRPPAVFASLGWALLIVPAITALVFLVPLLAARCELSANRPVGQPDIEDIAVPPAAPSPRDSAAFQKRLTLTGPLAVFLALLVCAPALPSICALMS